MKYFTIIGLFWVALSAVAQDYTAVFEARDCPYFMQQIADDDSKSISCGDLIVPEDRDDIANSLELRLFVVKIESVESNDNAPIVNLEGGPGGAASVGFQDWLGSDLQQTYDIILIDQRGTGLSYPSLNCYEMDEDDDNAVSDCRDRLVVEGINLNAYNSAANANDIYDLLVAMDVPEANIYGSSYGTRLGLTIMRDFPERVRTLTIDAVYPPQVDALTEQAFYGIQAFEQLFNDCATDSACDNAYPDLRQSFYAAIEKMNNAAAEIYDSEMDATIEMNGDDFAQFVFSQLYDTSYLRYLPALIAAYADGDYAYDPVVEDEEAIADDAVEGDAFTDDEIDAFAVYYLDFDNINDVYEHYDSLTDDEYFDLLDELIDEFDYLSAFRDYLDYNTIKETADYVYTLDDDNYFALEAEVLGTYDDDSEGMYFSVECAEEIHFYDEDDVWDRADEIPEILGILTESAVETFDDCDVWDVAESDAIENEPVVSDIPTLIFSGSYDPITPYQWGDDTQLYLENSSHFIFPNVGHGALDTQPCSTDIMLAFLETPAEIPDGSCVTDLSPPDFYIRP